MKEKGHKAKASVEGGYERRKKEYVKEKEHKAKVSVCGERAGVLLETSIEKILTV